MTHLYIMAKSKAQVPVTVQASKPSLSPSPTRNSTRSSWNQKVKTPMKCTLNGFSSSMPMDIQLDALHEIPALRDAKIYRPGYAIEYDYFDPTQLKHSLESKIIKGLFFAGQVNGTTGYEEAGGRGTVAGINAALHCVGNKTFEMKRDESYIGVLIDDLTTKGVDEPYRMFTSRAEYRILLRRDDADARLTEKAYELGIAKRDRYDWWMEKKDAIERIIDFCANYPIKKDEINPKLEALGTTPLRAGCKLIDLVARPHLNLQNLSEIIPDPKAAMEAPDNRKEEIAEAAEIKMKYKGYIERERLIADKMHRLENIRIKGRFNYSEILEISTEGRQKLERIDPDTLARASRIQEYLQATSMYCSSYWEDKQRCIARLTRKTSSRIGGFSKKNLQNKGFSAMFHVKPLLHKAFDTKELRAFCIK